MHQITGERAQQWRNAIAPDPAVRKRALDYWARRRNQLPGALLFTVTRQELLQGEWQRIVRQSEPRCKCGERRWLAPQVSVPFYVPDEPKQIVVGAGRQLAIGPWGGDTRSTFAQLSVDGSNLVVRAMPYSHLSAEQLRELGAVGISNATFQEGVLKGVEVSVTLTVIPLERLVAELAEASPTPHAMGVRVGALRSNRAYLFSPFAVYAVDLQANTLTVVVSANCQVMDRADRGYTHDCDTQR